METQQQEVLIFKCKECKHSEKITEPVEDYLDKVTTSSGVHTGCGTMNWQVVDKNGYFVI